MSNPLSRAELRSWLRLVSGTKGLFQALDRQLRDEAGMTHDDYEILAGLHRSPERSMRMSHLAREIGFSPSRLSHAIGRMETDGWVSRHPSDQDRRGTEVVLTDVGARVVEEATPAHLALVRKLVFETLGPESAAATAESFEQIGRAALGQLPDSRM